MGFEGYIRFPTLHGETIVFTADDDLWRVDASGGRAERLTAEVSEATNARFSPDGQSLAYIGRDEGPAEVYVMPADGGPSRRLTFQSSLPILSGWRPDGSAILYSSPAGQPEIRRRMLYAVAPQGGEPERQPYGVASLIAFGPDGAVVLGRNTAEPAFWKRYRGGTAGYLWIDPTGAGEFHRLLSLKANITAPCWVGKRIYFISDHEGIGNVYSCLPSGEDLRRHTAHEEFYARGLSTDGRRLVYTAGGALYLAQPDGAQGERLDVALVGTRPQRARKFVAAGAFLGAWAAHPQGHSVALAARGKPFSMGNWEGAVRQSGEPEGVRYRLLAWLADGKRLITVRDTGRDERLATLTADGSAPERVFDGLDVGQVVELRAAPVGEWVAFVNQRNELGVVDVASGELRILDRSPYGRNELAMVDQKRVMRGIAWSPDGQWLAYAFSVNPQQTAIKLCRVATGETFQITEPVLHDLQPAFDPQGRYLYFLSVREFDPVLDSMQFDLGFPRGMRPYLLTLRRDLRSPFVPEPSAPKSEAAQQLDAAKREEEPETPQPVAIDLDGIATRIVAFPVSDGRYGRILGTQNGALFTTYPVEGTLKSGALFGQEANGTLEFYSFETRKQERIAEGVQDFEVTPDGKTLVYRAEERLRALKAGEKPPQLEGEAQNKPGRESGWLDLERVKVSVTPPAEWRQMFGEAWRLQREQFVAPDMGGVDWQAVYDRYAPLVERIGSRRELSDLIWEMQGELGMSHAYEIGGEYRTHPEYAQGFLGVDWRLDAATGRYTIAHLVRGDPWNPDASSPLLAPGVNASAGDAVLAINGQPVSAERGPQQLLVHQAGAEVELLLQPAGGGEPRAVTVKALGDETPARYRDWVEANRRMVHEATQGRVGYLHIPDMMFRGFAEFHRGFLAEYDYEGLIVDVRWNRGGMVSSLVLEKLLRPRIGYSFQRWGAPSPYFLEAPRGRLVMLTDENAGSDGDIVSHGFKMLKLGPLIGKRTWGGVTGIDPYIQLVDGTETTQPEFGFWFDDTGWGVENYGTDPTIDVDYTPQDYREGRDPQLERGIAEMLRILAERPAPYPDPGPRPNFGWPRR